MCDEIKDATVSVPTNVINTIPTNVTNTILTNVTSTVSTNSDDKKVRNKIGCYILHKVLLVILLLLFIIAFICYPDAKDRSK